MSTLLLRDLRGEVGDAPAAGRFCGPRHVAASALWGTCLCSAGEAEIEKAHTPPGLGVVGFFFVTLSGDLHQ